MTSTPRTSARSAPLNHRRELTREEVRRELRRSQAIRSQSRALLAEDPEARSKSLEDVPACSHAKQ